MQKNAGKFTSFLKHPATLLTAGAGAATGTGFLTYKKGKNVGARVAAERVADEFANSFTAANEEENRKIIDDISQKFKDYNARENQEIAKHYFNRGAQMKSQMKKQALDRIYREALHDELEKIAMVPIPTSMLTSAAKTTGGWFRRNFSRAGGAVKRLGAEGKQAYSTMTPKQKALLGVAAGTTAGAGVGAGAMAHGFSTKNDRISRYPGRMAKLDRQREALGM